MGATPKKRLRSEIGQETAVAVAFAVLLLCLNMRRGHSRGCGNVGGRGFPPSITVLLPIFGGVDRYLLAKRSKGSLSFFFSYPPSMMIQFGQKETGRIEIILA